MKVKYALRGHRKEPRLWEKHIKGILTQHLGYTPKNHEPCLYEATINDAWTLLLRQVDDFPFVVPDMTLGQHIVKTIDKYMHIQIKYLDTLELFNSMDISPVRYYIKISFNTYLTQILHCHNWTVDTHKMDAITYPADNYTKLLDLATPPETEKEQHALSKLYNIHYRQVIGEIIWPMIKCRPDISFHITKLCQFMANPAKAHYQAIHELGHFLANMPDHGIYYWRDTPRLNLPEGPLRTVHMDTYNFKEDPTDCLQQLLTAYADSD